MRNVASRIGVIVLAWPLWAAASPETTETAQVLSTTVAQTFDVGQAGKLSTTVEQQRASASVLWKDPRNAQQQITCCCLDAASGKAQCVTADCKSDQTEQQCEDACKSENEVCADKK